jgi:proteasome lid subunit RPN8/RPN11
MILPKVLYDQMIAHARTAHPEECCGLVCGDFEKVNRLFPSENIFKGDKTTAFELDPKVRFQQIRETGERSLLGFYHSHPNGICAPSETDKSMVYEPELIWFLVTTEQVRAFQFDEKKRDFNEIALQIT